MLIAWRALVDGVGFFDGLVHKLIHGFSYEPFVHLGHGNLHASDILRELIDDLMHQCPHIRCSHFVHDPVFCFQSVLNIVGEGAGGESLQS